MTRLKAFLSFQYHAITCKDCSGRGKWTCTVGRDLLEVWANTV